MKSLFELEKTSINVDWKVLKIKRVLDTPITDGPHETPELLDEGIPFLSAESVKKGKLDFNLKRGYISQEDHVKYIKKCKPKRDDIFMIKSGATTGNVAMVETDEEFSIWSPLALIRADKKKILPKYLYYFIGSIAFRQQVEVSWSYGTQQNIGMKVIENLFISVPPLRFQEKLIQYMDAKALQIDRIIEMKEKKISLLEQQRQSVITEAVTKGLNPNVKMKYSGLEWISEIPEHWKMKKIKYLVDRMSREIQPDDEVVTAFRDGQVTLRKNRREDGFTFSLKEIGYQGIREGDLVVHQMDAFAGAIGVSDSNGKASPVYTVCTPKNDDEIYIPFLCEIIRVMSNSGYIESLAKGIRERSTDFRWRDMGDLFSFVPPLSEQIQIASYISKESQTIKDLIQSINNSIQKLKEYRQALIYEAVTGKIDVRNMELD